VEIALRELYGVRCGDKGDISDISLFADSEKAYECLVEQVTSERVKKHFGSMVSGHVERYLAPNVLAVKFVMYGALGGGAPSSLRSDNLGKTNGASLLRMKIDVPEEILAGSKRAKAPIEEIRATSSK
jgi:hypothetical protein